MIKYHSFALSSLFLFFPALFFFLCLVLVLFFVSPQVSNTQPEEISFRIHQKFRSDVLQPAAVTVYEYYKSESQRRLTLPQWFQVVVFASIRCQGRKHDRWVMLKSGINTSSKYSMCSFWCTASSTEHFLNIFLYPCRKTLCEILPSAEESWRDPAAL